MSFLEKRFKLTELGTNIKTEFRAGFATFLTMAYILAANPFFLTQAGVPADVAFAGTAWAAAIGTAMMGILTNTPFAMAPGMGLNAALVFGVILGLGVSWQVGMGVIVVEGLLVFFAVQLGLRTALMKAIPHELKMAIGAGIGVFLLALGIEAAGQGWIRTTPTPVSGTNITAWVPSLPAEISDTMWLMLIGLLLYWGFRKLSKNGAILFSILATTAVAVIFYSVAVPDTLVQSAQLPTLISLGDVWKVVVTPALYVSVFAFFIADFFDTLGTGVAVSNQGGFFDRLNEPKTLKAFLGWDALAASVSGMFSASSTTTYIESASGVAEGGRSGLASVFTGLFFLLALPFAPLVLVVASTPGATAPALIVIGIMMLGILRKEIEWSSLNPEMWLSVLITIVVMPLTKSISHGIGAGFIAFVILSWLVGRKEGISGLMYLAATAFLVSFFI